MFKCQIVTFSLAPLFQTVPKVGRAKVPGASVDRPARIEQEKFQFSVDIRLHYKVVQPDRRSLHMCRSVLVHRDHVVLKDASLTRSRIASFTIATQTLLSGHLDVYAVVLPSPGVPSDSGDGVH